MPIVTVTGSLGSGAREIALASATRLGLDYVDREILVEAARQLGVTVAAVESRDERPTSIGERLASVMRTLMERSAQAGSTDPAEGGGIEMVLARTYGEAAGLPSDTPGGLDDARYLETLESVIRGVAARGSVVILGRGGQAILRDEPSAVHVYVVAPKEHRIRALAAAEGTSEEDAAKRVKQSDHDRRLFHSRYFKVEVDDLSLYDMVIQTARVRRELAVELIAMAALDRAPRPG
jgi:CMP/dCMP kinase